MTVSLQPDCGGGRYCWMTAARGIHRAGFFAERPPFSRQLMVGHSPASSSALSSPPARTIRAVTGRCDAPEPARGRTHESFKSSVPSLFPQDPAPSRPAPPRLVPSSRPVPPRQAGRFPANLSSHLFKTERECDNYQPLS